MADKQLAIRLAFSRIKQLSPPKLAEMKLLKIEPCAHVQPYIGEFAILQ